MNRSTLIGLFSAILFAIACGANNLNEANKLTPQDGASLDKSLPVENLAADCQCGPPYHNCYYYAMTQAQYTPSGPVTGINGNEFAPIGAINIQAAEIVQWSYGCGGHAAFIFETPTTTSIEVRDYNLGISYDKHYRRLILLFRSQLISNS